MQLLNLQLLLLMFTPFMSNMLISVNIGHSTATLLQPSYCRDNCVLVCVCKKEIRWSCVSWQYNYLLCAIYLPLPHPFILHCTACVLEPAAGTNVTGCTSGAPLHATCGPNSACVPLGERMNSTFCSCCQGQFSPSGSATDCRSSTGQ